MQGLAGVFLAGECVQVAWIEVGAGRVGDGDRATRVGRI
jgi:hypothetical protein